MRYRVEENRREECEEQRKENITNILKMIHFIEEQVIEKAATEKIQRC